MKILNYVFFCLPFFVDLERVNEKYFEYFYIFPQEFTLSSQEASNEIFGELEILHQIKNERKVAIKFIKTKINCAEEENRALKLEVNYLSRLKHENLMQFLGWTEWMEKKAIVLEFMHTSLRSGKISSHITYF